MSYLAVAHPCCITYAQRNSILIRSKLANCRPIENFGSYQAEFNFYFVPQAGLCARITHRFKKQ